MLPDVAQIIFQQHQQVLLGLRQNTGVFDQLWGFPSGRVEVGEKLIDAAVREAMEEVGVRPLRLELLLRIKDAASARFHQVYLCTAWAGTLHNDEPHLCRELRWFERHTAPVGCTPVTYAIWPAMNAAWPAGSANCISAASGWRVMHKKRRARG